MEYRFESYCKNYLTLCGIMANMHGLGPCDAGSIPARENVKKINLPRYSNW